VTYVDELIKISGVKTPSDSMSVGDADGFEQGAKIAKKDVQKSKLNNQDLQKKTDAMQEEYEKLLSEMETFKNQREHGEDFYQTYQEMYGRGKGDEKHESPTKRLVALKDTTVEHKGVMDKKGARYGDSYKLTYCANPTKSYVVEPGKEINYKLAEKDPEKFY
jgi:hypothetical protein